ncbi:hypothetical protein [Parafilimonas sp.]|uniref:hypothetical protein n=1 Tax=Parafilimonas sp. TaxID=1969739 RepID=UPI0039E5FFF5
MKTFIYVLLFITGFFQKEAINTKDLNRQAFYNAVKSESLKAIDEQIAAVQASGLKDKDAFEGTLLMKKAGLVKGSKNKLDLFKDGRIKLETAIQNDNSNTEYRFMRLIIQEHAPKIVKYRDELAADAAFIEKNFRNLSPGLQNIIIDYSKESKTLKTTNLQ